VTGILARVTDALAGRAEAASDPRVTVGDDLILVEVSSPEGRPGRQPRGTETPAGIAHRPEGTVGRVGVDLETAAVQTLLGLATDGETHLARAVGLATANALSAPDMDWWTGDPMAALAGDVETIATVGLFGPAFRKFEALEVRVAERNPPESVDAPDGVTVELFEPGECEAAFAGADLCFVTGSVFIYGGVDRYLGALEAGGVSPVVLVGATASHLPGPAFDAGVDVVAGARVTDPETVRRRIQNRECATALHGAGVEKVYVTRGDTPDALELP